MTFPNDDERTPFQIGYEAGYITGYNAGYNREKYDARPPSERKRNRLRRLRKTRNMTAEDWKEASEVREREGRSLW